MTEEVFCPFCTKPLKGDRGLTAHVSQSHREAMRQLRLIAPLMPKEDWQRERALLVEQIELLKREIYGLSWVSPPELKLTAAQDCIVAAMVAHDRVLSDQFLFDASRTRGTSSDEMGSHLVTVMICHIRKKLEPFGLKIRTVYGRGYCLPPATRQALLNWPAEQSAAA